MASVQGPQSVLETTGIFGCPVTWGLETFRILRVKKECDTKIMTLLGTPPLFKVFVPQSFDKPRKRNHGNEQNKKPVSTVLKLDMLTHQLSR